MDGQRPALLGGSSLHDVQQILGHADVTVYVEHLADASWPLGQVGCPELRRAPEKPTGKRPRGK